MVYHLSEIENKRLLNELRPLSRRVGVTEELRGWNWEKSPLKPYHNISLPMYLICGDYCPNSRDIYLNRIEGKKGEWNHPLSLGKVIHDTVNEAYNRARAMEFDADFQEWYLKQDYENWMNGNFQLIRRYAEMTWSYVLTNARSRLQSMLSSQPYSTEEDALSTAIPFLIEHKISGELLGCSGILSVDCYDYMRSIIFDLKTGVKRQENYRIYPTGYALVFESVYEVPVDIGCTVYLRFKNDRLLIERDIFHINDNLRSWWIENRDKKSEMVYEEIDPGRPPECPSSCIYINVCGD